MLSKRMRSRNAEVLLAPICSSQRGLLQGVFPWGFLKPARLAAGRGRNHSVFLQGSVRVYCSAFLLSFMLAWDFLSLKSHPAEDLHTPHFPPC